MAPKTSEFAIKHKASGSYLHMHRFNAKRQAIATNDVRQCWRSSKLRAEAQAAILEPVNGWVAVELSV